MIRKVVHVCPTYFSPHSVIAGAERYSYGLARAMSQLTETSLVTFGADDFVHVDDRLTVKCFKRLFYVDGNRANPFALRYLKDLLRADVVHCHQYLTVTTDLAILLGVVSGKKVFVTDLGGGTGRSLSCHLPLWRGIRSLLAISDYNRNLYRRIPLRAQVIYGGVDAERFSPAAETRLPRVLHVGRILAFKGIHDLVEALPPGIGLDIVGQASDERYLKELQERARGKDVAFHLDLSDERLVGMYRRALATVLPATLDSGFTTALESQACATPVIAAATGSLPEVVREGITGFLVPPKNPGAIGDRIERLRTDPGLAARMGASGRSEVLERFTWEAVARRCLDAYASA